MSGSNPHGPLPQDTVVPFLDQAAGNFFILAFPLRSTRDTHMAYGVTGFARLSTLLRYSESPMRVQRHADPANPALPMPPRRLSQAPPAFPASFRNTNLAPSRNFFHQVLFPLSRPASPARASLARALACTRLDTLYAFYTTPLQPVPSVHDGSGEPPLAEGASDITSSSSPVSVQAGRAQKHGRLLPAASAPRTAAAKGMPADFSQPRQPVVVMVAMLAASARVEGVQRALVSRPHGLPGTLMSASPTATACPPSKAKGPVVFLCVGLARVEQSREGLTRPKGRTFQPPLWGHPQLPVR